MEIALVGTIRDGGPELERRICRIEKAFKFASHIHWIVIESDSADHTGMVLQNICNRHQSFLFESLGNLRERLPLRTERLAFCRNRYLDLLRQTEKYSKVELVAVLDLDGVNDDLDADAVISTFARTDWHVVAANQSEAYFDIWALRARDWSEGDCWRQAKFLTNHGVSAHWAQWSCVYAKMIEIDRDAPWIEVDSAFGGLAIYRREVLQFASYCGLADDKTEVCEHVALHASITSEGGKIFINPKLINSGLNEHVNGWWDLMLMVKKT